MRGFNRVSLVFYPERSYLNLYFLAIQMLELRAPNPLFLKKK